MRKLRTHAASIDEQVLEGVLGQELFKTLKNQLRLPLVARKKSDRCLSR
jgi:hypothetical protein